MTRHVAVLMGGWSAEREVSLVSGDAVARALRERGHTVTAIDVGRNIASVLHGLRPDVVFNALHGRYGEDGTIQGVLEVLEIPYTHSGLLASALAMNKPAAKAVFAGAGIPVPEGGVYRRSDVAQRHVMPPPYVVKPLNEGSSVGVTLVFAGENRTMAHEDWAYGDDVLVERYIPGREIHVAVMGDRALGAIEIKPRGRFYDYQAKYTPGFADHVMPAPLPENDYATALDLGLQAHRALGCRGVSRADLRYDDTGPRGAFYMLEVNTQPGMTPLSLVPEIATHSGIDFGELVDWMIEDASCPR
jgi:D-alanine-D-alanine ligase